MNNHVNPKKLLDTTEDVITSCFFNGSDKPNISSIKHFELGKPNHIWAYNNNKGELLGFICRFDLPDENGNPKKEIRPLSYISKNHEPPRWMWRGLPEPRPLYNLDQLHQRKYKKAIICEGEKAADAASKLFPNDLCTSPMFGAQAPHKTDWSPLIGCDVIIVGDNDEAGRKFTEKVALLIGDIDDVAIQFLDIKHIGNQKISDCGTKLEPTSTCPSKYDLADAVDEGWTFDLMQTFIKDNKSKVLRDFVRPNWPFRLKHNHVER